MHAPASPLCASCLGLARSSVPQCMTMIRKSPLENCWKNATIFTSYSVLYWYDMPCANIFIGRLAKRRGCSGPPTAGATTDGVAARTSAGRG